MVEGPGCKLKGEKIRAKICGQQIKKVSGNAVTQKFGKQSKKENSRPTGSCKLMVLVDCRLEEVQVLGKELFMYFGKNCLRVHFLMNGSFRLNGKQSDPDGGSQKALSPVLVLEMTKDCVAFYESSVDIRCSDKCREKHDSMKTLDICSSVFSHTRALDLIKTHSDRLLCDVLLDQSVLPGVGNIIKNEALFDSGIKPDTKVVERKLPDAHVHPWKIMQPCNPRLCEILCLVKDLKEAHLKHLIRMTRDFSMLFYQCRKTGVSLGKYMKVYGKEKCGQCQGKVVLCRMGQDSDRYTYFCHNCQTNDLKHNTQILPQKNSLLGWLKARSPSRQSEWTCTACTLINKAGDKHCVVCLTPKELDCTKNEQMSCNSRRTVEQDSIGIPDKNGTLQLSKQQSNENVSEAVSVTDSSDYNGASSTHSHVQKRKLDSLPVPDSKRLKTGQSIGSSENQHDPGGPSNNKHRIPNCPDHKKTCAMREVRKEGANMRRMFFTCSLPRGKQCQFFKWADEDFPVCPGHGKPCCLRTVLKQGPNNGKKFFTCSVMKKKQCGFFQWAEGYG